MKNKGIFFVLVMLATIGLFCKNMELKPCFADNPISEQVYSVYDEEGVKIFERYDISVGDVIINSDFVMYEIICIDYQTNSAKAIVVGQVEKPKIKKIDVKQIASIITDKKIAMYMTHNDESYELGDGYASIYGAGGIHDIANLLQSALERYDIAVTLDETLHIPHDSGAYSRSAVTANALMEDSPDALFDIHRDGASRSTYVSLIDGTERCKIRIVVGQRNPNKERNLEFAMYLMAVADEICPWLFLDIYYASGHYNQALSSKALLFEMGSHLVEKDLVEHTVSYLANIINVTLYNTEVQSDGSLEVTDFQVENSINEILNQEPAFTISPIWYYVGGGVLIFFIGIIFVKRRTA